MDHGDFEIPPLSEYGLSPGRTVPLWRPLCQGKLHAEFHLLLEAPLTTRPESGHPFGNGKAGSKL